jgi:hypothetical protein
MIMGPLNMPWSTFMAFVVTAASIVISIAWAVCDIRRSGKRQLRTGPRV